MPGAIDLPPPGAWRLAFAFNHHRKVGTFFLHEVHAAEHTLDDAQTRVNSILSKLSAGRRFFSPIKQTRKCGDGRIGFGQPLSDPTWSLYRSREHRFSHEPLPH